MVVTAAKMNSTRNIEVPVIDSKSSGGFLSGGYHRALMDVLLLTKARVNLLVVGTTFAGFAMHANPTEDFWLLIHTLGGTGMVAAGAAVANQSTEWRFDQRMPRTSDRPVAAGRVSRRTAAVMSGLLVIAGCLWLWLGANWVASLLAGISFFIYACLYTPSKRLTPLCTLIGAIAGALPFLVGWVATAPKCNIWAVSGFAFLFLWQIPHFLAIAWWRREEYSRAGFRVLPDCDHEGRQTALWTVLGAFLLLPVLLAPALWGVAAPWYIPAGTAFGVVFVIYCFRFMMKRTAQCARTLFVVSLLYLPAVYTMMLLAQKPS